MKGKPPSLETERLFLRPMVQGDSAFLVTLYQDAEVMKTIWSGVRSQEQAEKSLQVFLSHWHQHGFGMFLVFERTHQQPIGYIGLRYLENSQEVELGFIFAKHSWGRGYATEAARAVINFGFSSLHCDHIVAITLPEAVHSQRVLSKLGMVLKEERIAFGCKHKLFTTLPH